MALASPVPHLTTAQQGPLQQLEAQLLANQSEIEGWLRHQWLQTPAPFYCSVDLRNAGHKLAPVDTNLFPAGFNNLNPSFEPLCIQALQSAMERACPTAAGILLVPENHTRNRFYLESLATLAGLIRKAGFKLRIGSLSDEITSAQTLMLDSGRELVLEPLRREGDRLYVDDFSPCAVLLNNDLSGGRPTLLEGLEQPVIPPLGLGWSNRLKSQHFALYREVVEEFATRIDIDPWLVDPMFRNCGQINFMKREGEDCLAGNVAMLLEEIREKYKEYGIEREPYVVVKADAGTYGMAVMSVKSPDELRDMNRKQRTRMAALKEGREVTGAIIQEGVYTSETWGPNKAPAEPVVYMIDHFVVGGFYRIHGNKESDGILNSPGMEFQPLAFAHSCTTPDHAKAIDAEPNRFYAYGVVARLALLAAAREIAQQQNPTSA